MRTLGGVWATAGAAASNTATATPRSIDFMTTSFCAGLPRNADGASVRELIYQHKWTWQYIYRYKYREDGRVRRGEFSMTYSIVARDPETGAFGVATATGGPAVGSLVPHARAEVGAIA